MLTKEIGSNARFPKEGETFKTPSFPHQCGSLLSCTFIKRFCFFFLPPQQKFETKKEVLASSLVPDYEAKQPLYFTCSLCLTQFAIYLLRSLIHGDFFFSERKELCAYPGVTETFGTQLAVVALRQSTWFPSWAPNSNGNAGADAQNKSTGSHTSNFKLQLNFTNLN